MEDPGLPTPQTCKKGLLCLCLCVCVSFSSSAIFEGGGGNIIRVTMVLTFRGLSHGRCRSLFCCQARCPDRLSSDPGGRFAGERVSKDRGCHPTEQGGESLNLWIRCRDLPRSPSCGPRPSAGLAPAPGPVASHPGTSAKASARKRRLVRRALKDGPSVEGPFCGPRSGTRDSLSALNSGFLTQVMRG